MLGGVTTGSLRVGAIVLVLSSACGGATTFDPDFAGSGGSTPVAAGSGGAQARPDAGVVTVAGQAGEATVIWSDYVPTECPDTAPPPVNEECELFGAVNTCPEGTACFPYVEYPDGTEPCAREQYGTGCFVSGEGLQGEPCDWGTCAGGHLCVLTGEGTQCVQLCDTFGADTCPAGLFCEPIDVQPGIGGCY